MLRRLLETQLVPTFLETSFCLFAWDEVYSSLSPCQSISTCSPTRTSHNNITMPDRLSWNSAEMPFVYRSGFHSSVYERTSQRGLFSFTHETMFKYVTEDWANMLRHYAEINNLCFMCASLPTFLFVPACRRKSQQRIIWQFTFYGEPTFRTLKFSSYKNWFIKGTHDANLQEFTTSFKLCIDLMCRDYCHRDLQGFSTNFSTL